MITTRTLQQKKERAYRLGFEVGKMNTSGTTVLQPYATRVLAKEWLRGRKDADASKKTA
jgi:hypothetical protein